MKGATIVINSALSIVALLSPSKAGWEQTNGPGGGVVSVLAKTGNTIFASINGDAVYRSTNNGDSWSPVNIGGEMNFNKFATKDSTIFASNQRAIFRSTDNGMTWQKMHADDGSSFIITALAVFDDYLFAGILDSGIIRSADNGVTWIPVNNGLVSSQLSINCFAVIGKTILASCPFKPLIYRSTDSGKSWSVSNSGLPDKNCYNVNAFAVRNSTVYAGTDQSGIFVSSDSGTHWTPINSGIPYSRVESDTNVILYPPIQSLTISENTLIAVSYGTTIAGAFLSTNDGVTWSDMVIDSPIATIRDCIFNGQFIFAGTAGTGIFRSSNNGQNWVPVNSGLALTKVACIVANDHLIFAGTYGAGAFISTDNGKKWTAVNAGLMDLEIFPVALKWDTIFVGTGVHGVYRSFNNGETWTSVSSGIKEPVRIHCLAIDDGVLFAKTYTGVYRSTDNGEHWIAANKGFTDSSSINCLAVCCNTLFGGGTQGLYVYDTTGNSWNKVNPGPDSIYSLAGNENTVFAGTYSKGLLISNDKGQKWHKANIPYERISPRITVPIRYIAASGSNICVSVNGSPPDLPSGTYLSIDNGENWTLFGADSLTNFSPANIAFKDSLLFAGTGEGVWYTPISGITGITPVPRKPYRTEDGGISLRTIGLHHPRITVTLCLSHPKLVSIGIFNLKGEWIASLVNKWLQPGTYCYFWNSAFTVPGIYSVRIQAGSNSVIKRVPVLR